MRKDAVLDVLIPRKPPRSCGQFSSLDRCGSVDQNPSSNHVVSSAKHVLLARGNFGGKSKSVSAKLPDRSITWADCSSEPLNWKDPTDGAELLSFAANTDEPPRMSPRLDVTAASSKMNVECKPVQGSVPYFPQSSALPKVARQRTLESYEAPVPGYDEHYKDTLQQADEPTNLQHVACAEVAV